MATSSYSDGSGHLDGGGSSRPILTPSSSRYESQKRRRDWRTFGQYLKNHRPPLALSRCSGAHVLEFLRYLDQFGKTKVHVPACPFYGHPNPPAPCSCPLRQAWGSLDALIGRLRAAFEENGGQPDANPFGARAVRLYLREVRDMQSKARGITYEKKKKKKRKRPPPAPSPVAASAAAPVPGDIVVAGNYISKNMGDHDHQSSVVTGGTGSGGGGGGGGAAAATYPYHHIHHHLLQGHLLVGLGGGGGGAGAAVRMGNEDSQNGTMILPLSVLN